MKELGIEPDGATWLDQTRTNFLMLMDVLNNEPKRLQEQWKPMHSIAYYHHSANLKELFNWFKHNGPLDVPLGNTDPKHDKTRQYGDLYIMSDPNDWPLHVLRSIDKAQRTDLEQAQYLLGFCA